MSVTIDLTPRPRHEARARTKRIRAWCAAGGLYAGALTLAVLVLRSELSYDRGELKTAITRTRQQNLDQSAQRTQLLNERATLQRSMAASTAIRGQPDWSVPLAVVANAFDGDGVFESIQVNPVFAPRDPRAQRDSADAPERLSLPVAFVIGIEGYCTDDRSLTALIGTLEGSKLFESVKWVESRREAYHGTEMVRFRIDCAVGGAER